MKNILIFFAVAYMLCQGTAPDSDAYAVKAFPGTAAMEHAAPVPVELGEMISSALSSSTEN